MHAGRGDERRPRGTRGGVRAGRRRDSLRGRGRRDPDRERHALRPVGLDLDRERCAALRVARALETGVLSVNSNTSVRAATPFGGFKQSGFGRELGMPALDGYTEVKSGSAATEPYRGTA